MDIQSEQSYFSKENLNFIENILLTNSDILSSYEKYSQINSKLMYLICKLFVQVSDENFKADIEQLIKLMYQVGNYNSLLCYQLGFQNKGK